MKTTGVLKARAGFVPVSQRLFWELYPQLEYSTKQCLTVVEKNLKQVVDLVSWGLVGDRKEADEAGRFLAKEDIDLLVIWEIGYASSDIPERVISRVGNKPIVLLVTQRDSFVPSGMDYVRYMENTALTGMTELGGALSKNGIEQITLVGTNDDASMYERLGRMARAARLKTELSKLNIGLLGHVFPGMLDTVVDERFVNRIGPSVTFITLPELERRIKAIPDERVRALLEETKGNYDSSCVHGDDLFRAARLYCALEDIINDMDINALSLLSQDYVNVVADAPPCFALSMLQNRLGLATGCEGDIGNTIGAYILRRLTGVSPMFADWTMFDEKNNAVFFQHCGVCDPTIAAYPKLTPHSEKFGFSGEGIAFEVSGKPGPVTMVALIYDYDGWKIFASEGEALQVSEQPCRLNQMTVVVKDDVKRYLEKVCNLGVPHHLNIGYGHVKEEIEYLTRLLEAKFVTV